jgi:ribosome-associated protein
LSKFTSRETAEKIVALALSKKAEDVVLLDLRPLTGMTDFFVICEGGSDLQISAIADAVLDGMKKEKVRVWHREGYTNRSWVLLDYVDVVVHIFSREVRRFYNLERLWGDAETVRFDED